MGNTLTTMFAEQILVNEKMGKGNETDLLAISYTSTDYVGHMYGINAIELEDTYLRLDKEIAELLNFLDSHEMVKKITCFFNRRSCCSE